MRDFYREHNSWRGMTALTLVGAGAIVAIVCSVMAALVLHKD